MKKTKFSATAILIGTVIGAGIFGLPYAISKPGLSAGLIYIAVFGILFALLLNMFGEVIERTKAEMQVSGYAKKYLGRWGGAMMTFAIIGSSLGAMLAYIIGVGEFSMTLIGNTIGGSVVLYGTIFFIISSIIILKGVSIIAAIEQYMVFIIIGIVIAIFVIGLPEISASNLSFIDVSNSIFPLGVVFFAFGGVSALPEMKKVLKKQSLKPSVNNAMLVCSIVYTIFVIAVVGVSGQETTKEAMRGLIPFLGSKIIYIGAILGIITMTTSFLTIGLIVKEVFIKDYKINPIIAWLVTCLSPYVLFLVGVKDFISVLSVVGSVSGGVIGILIVSMFITAKKKGDKKITQKMNVPLPIIILLYMLFVIGTFSEFIF